ncbi:DUF2726 domain-containing protein [Massilia sp. TSP1-1-2]|uniref:DUF2726 domain-containing protein n=1 Tax=unclassified Massilia TaxID=2609279 RepID=UPI003CE72E48
MLSRLLKKSQQLGPAYGKKPYINAEQLAFYQRLRQALPNCTVFPDVALSALIKPLADDTRQLRQQQEKLAGRRLAYGVFTDMLELLCVIELTSAGEQSEERALTLACLQDAGIPCFSWEQANLPSRDQILRTMAAFTDIAPARLQPAANSVMRSDFPAPDSVLPVRGPAVFSLTVEELQKLTPNGHVKAAYPHIWERICLFCPEPRHLEQYLSSLSLQDRSSKRTGFSESVIVELADLQGANARFIPTQVRVRGAWNDIFENR